jgi:hypothetical protein
MKEHVKINDNTARTELRDSSRTEEVLTKSKSLTFSSEPSVVFELYGVPVLPAVEF